MSHATYLRRIQRDDFEVDRHLTSDKVGGLFAYDGSDGPKITRANRMIAQFCWAAIGGPVYLYDSNAEGLYLYHYR